MVQPLRRTGSVLSDSGVGGLPPRPSLPHRQGFILSRMVPSVLRRWKAKLSPPPRVPGLEEIQRQEMTHLFGRVMVVRLVLSPLILLVGMAVALIDPAPWRKWLLPVMGLMLMAVSLVEWRRFRRLGTGLLTHPTNFSLVLALVVLTQSLVILGTGGLESPGLPVMLPASLVGGVFLSRPNRVAMLVTQTGILWLLAALSIFGWIPDLTLEAFGGGPSAGHSQALLFWTALVMTVALQISSLLGRVMRRAFDGMLARALHARDEVLCAHAVRLSELTALSGEIAHELKNPLASVKGLATLLARDAGEGKAAERLEVLRREVDRMQGILEEFLNFSRPLLPLHRTPTDLSSLCEEVVALHEGMARERGVSLSVGPGASVPADVDPRKLIQVLINLVQNALEASSPGGLVTLTVRQAGPERTSVWVEDEGPGLSLEMTSRVFEAGVTDKEKGAGLGLTVARALVRQHGGDLELHNLPQGGCRAVLDLPLSSKEPP